MVRHPVILRHCETYAPDRIAQIIGEGMDELGIRPQGYTLIKPNVVVAHKLFFTHAFTRPEFIDGLLTAVRERGGEITRLGVGERSGITVPTRNSFSRAGYGKVLRKHRVRPVCFDEVPQVPVELKHPQALRREIRVPQPIAQCDFLINAPKFKAHPWTKVTFALKNYIGIQDDAHRLIDHDHMLHTKIADLQEVISPGFIAMDGIIAGGRTMLTPVPHPLHLIIMGTNPVAVDVVCTHIVRLDPRDVEHIRICAERGYGPLDLEQIEIRGDVTLPEAQERGDGLELTLKRVDQIFQEKGSNVKLYIGPPPDTYDYCWGGCPGALFEAIQIIESMQPAVHQEIRPLHVVIGRYEGEILAQPGERVLFAGDCTSWRGKIQGQEVEIPSVYQSREQLSPHNVRRPDIMAKMLAVMQHLWRERHSSVLCVRGCPVSVAENVLYLSRLGKVVNPYLHPKIALKFNYHWLCFRLARWWKNR